MKRSLTLAISAAAALVIAPLAADAQGKYDFGRTEYESNCAVCHGATAKGDGAYMAFMAYKGSGVSDLTLIARRNSGTFPFQKVYETIDGTQALDLHGPRDMPIWGRDYLRRAREAYRDQDFDVIGPYQPDLFTRTRVLALTDYLSRIQVR